MAQLRCLAARGMGPNKVWQALSDPHSNAKRIDINLREGARGVQGVAMLRYGPLISRARGKGEHYMGV